MQLQETTSVTAFISFDEFGHIVDTCLNSNIKIKGYSVQPPKIRVLKNRVVVTHESKSAHNFVKLYMILTAGVTKITHFEKDNKKRTWKVVGKKDSTSPTSVNLLENFLDKYGPNQAFFKENTKVQDYLERFVKRFEVKTLSELQKTLRKHDRQFGGIHPHGKKTYDAACSFVASKLHHPLSTPPA